MKSARLIALAPLVAAALAIAIASCGGSELPTSSDESNATATTYMGLEEFLQQPGQEDGNFQALQTALANNFLDICGDTFCGSDYSNLTPISFACSVTSKEGKLKACTYTFAGSYSSTDQKTGKIATNAKLFACPIAISGAQKTVITALLAPTTATQTENTLRRVVPGLATSIYDQIANNCLP